MTGPVETKVVASSGASLLVGAVFGLAATYHWFTPPPVYVQTLIITLLTFAAGWLAPHTSRPKLLTQAQTDLLNQVAALAHPVPAPPVVTHTGSPGSTVTYSEPPAQPPAGPAK